MLTKKLLNVSATFFSSDITSSKCSVEFSLHLFSIKVIFDLVLTLSVKNGLTVFQKVLLSVISLVLRLLKNCFLAYLIRLTHKFRCVLYALRSMSLLV